MAITSSDKLSNLKIEQARAEAKDQERIKFAFQALQVASANDRASPWQDKTTYPKKTKGQKLEESGEYLKDPETEVDTSQPLQIKGMPPEINPEEHKRLQKQKKIRNITEKGATAGEREAGRGKLQDKTQLPDFLQNINIKPQDLLKILQLIPALTGGGLGQMASHQNLTDYLDKTGRSGRTGSYKGSGVPPEEILKHLKIGVEKFKA